EVQELVPEGGGRNESRRRAAPRVEPVVGGDPPGAEVGTAAGAELSPARDGRRPPGAPDPTLDALAVRGRTPPGKGDGVEEQQRATPSLVRSRPRGRDGPVERRVRQDRPRGRSPAAAGSDRGTSSRARSRARRGVGLPRPARSQPSDVAAHVPGPAPAGEAAPASLGRRARETGAVAGHASAARLPW